MAGLVITNARVLTLAGDGRPRRGPALGGLGALARGEVVIEGDRVASVTDLGAGGRPERPADARIVNAGGRVLMPAFVDCHTHACWAGDRLDEWDRKRAGASYLDILKSGGGIMSTVRAVRGATDRDLSESLARRLRAMAREGTATVEVKSGYGLDTDTELKMLRAIDTVRRSGEPGLPTIVATALLGHAIDPDVPRERFIHATIRETLPAVHEAFPGIAVDAYCEEGAWTVEECAALFEAASALGHPFRVHTDQFHALGMTEWAIDHGAASVDHLEATPRGTLRLLGASESVGVVLPCCGFHVDGRYADGRALIDSGGALAVATNLNPGSAPCGSMPMAIALAVRHGGLSPAEAIVGATRNGAAVLGLADRGEIAPGRRADLILLRHTDERMLAYEFGGDPVDGVVIAGRIVKELSA